MIDIIKDINEFFTVKSINDEGLTLVNYRIQNEEDIGCLQVINYKNLIPTLTFHSLQIPKKYSNEILYAYDDYKNINLIKWSKQLAIDIFNSNFSRYGIENTLNQVTSKCKGKRVLILSLIDLDENKIKLDKEDVVIDINYATSTKSVGCIKRTSNIKVSEIGGLQAMYNALREKYIICSDVKITDKYDELIIIDDRVSTAATVTYLKGKLIDSGIIEKNANFSVIAIGLKMYFTRNSLKHVMMIKEKSKKYY